MYYNRVIKFNNILLIFNNILAQYQKRRIQVLTKHCQGVSNASKGDFLKSNVNSFPNIQIKQVLTGFRVISGSTVVLLDTSKPMVTGT